MLFAKRHANLTLDRRIARAMDRLEGQAFHPPAPMGGRGKGLETGESRLATHWGLFQLSCTFDPRGDTRT